MDKPIVDPPVPFTSPIHGGLSPGKMVRIQGTVPQAAERFNINLQTGPNEGADIGLHMAVRLQEMYIARNSFIGGMWGDEHGHGNMPIAPGQRFEILILCDPQDYKIAINGQHYTEFPHRLPFANLNTITIEGTVQLSLVAFEGAGAPPMMNNQPPPNFAPPGQYGPPGPGGPPPGQYGPGPGGPPPPPGHQPQESGGVGDFLEQAAPFLSGVIKSGAVEKLFSSFGGGGNQQQAPNQGPPPQQMQPQQPPPQQPLQNNLNPQNIGGQPSIGGLGSVGSILTNLAGELFSGATNRDQRH